MMKPKKHKFVVIVKTTGTQKYARTAILSAFARRLPDGCEFSVIGHGRHSRNMPRIISGSAAPFPWNPAHRIGTCSTCGKEMIYNVPRMGAAGGWVHKDTGGLPCDVPPKP